MKSIGRILIWQVVKRDYVSNLNRPDPHSKFKGEKSNPKISMR
jgi:hypothetical protein